MQDSDHPASRPDLEPVLRRLRRRIRRVQHTRGLLATLVMALAALLALVLIDARLSPLPLALRWTLTISWFAIAAGTALVAWLLPMRRPLELLKIARWLEIRHPELDERISTAMELSGSGGGGVSQSLLAELSRAALSDLAGIDPRTEISMRRARRWLVPALGLLAGWVALFGFAPDWTARHVVRALSPNSRLGNAAESLTVEPGSVELIEGDALRVVARFASPPVVQPEIVLRLADGGSLVEPMRGEEGSHIYQLDKVTAGFDYEVRAGRATSDRFRVSVWPRPRLADSRLRLVFPAYTGLAAREQSVADGLTAVAGTRITLSATLNTPVSGARFELDGKPGEPVRLEHSAAGGSLDCGWTLDQPGRVEALLTLSHRLGRDFEAARFNVETLGDSVPEVKWTRPTAKELKVRPDEVLDLVYQATDDFGIGMVTMEVNPGQGKQAALPQALPELLGKAVPPVWRGEIRQPVGDFLDRWPGASTFKLRMRVADARPTELGGSNSSVSDWIIIRLDRGAEPLARQELFAAHSDVRETLEQARRAVEEARWRIESKREDLKKGEVKEGARKELEKAREKLAEAAEQLEELADRMEETPHAPKAEAVREAAAKAEQAREKLENTPLQDNEKAREQMAEAARKEAEDAEKQLRDLLDKVQRDEPRLHDLARLQDLAQRQQELARQAEQARAETPPETPADADWRRQQEQAAWEMRDLAAQHPQAKAEALAQEAQKARELAAEAREQAAGQEALKEQAREAGQPNQPNPPETSDLRAELAKEQAAIRDAVNEQVAAATERNDRQAANTLPEAAQAASKAAESLQQPDPAAAAEATAAAAKEIAEAAAAAAKPEGGEPSSENQAGEKQAGEKQAGEKQAGEKQAGEKQAGEKQAGENQAGENQAGENQAGENQAGENQAGTPQDNAAQQAANEAAAAQAAAELGDLAERQQQVAEVAKQLAAGNENAARQELAKMRAEQAAELAKEIGEAPHVGDNPGAMQQAANAANQAAGHAGNAAQQAQAAQAAAPHGEAAAQLQQAAASLDQAASELSNQAAQAAQQAGQASPQQAPMPGKPLAEAFQQAAQAARAPSGAAAASQARAAANALAQAARDTGNAMRQGSGPPKPGGQAQPGQPSEPGTEPGTKPDENYRTRQADPGVPPELAKLGISAEDWEQIKSSLKAESGGSGAIPLPEEYRDLVRKYFEQMSKGGKDE
jgi:hypothetical protein